MEKSKGSVEQAEVTQSESKSSKKGGKGCFITLIIVVLVFLFISFCSLVGFFLLVAASPSSDGNTLKEGGEDVIAVIRVDGVISSSSDTSFFSSASGAHDVLIAEQLDMVMDDDTVKAVIVRIESPGGEVVASDVISRKVLEVREVKPVVAYSSTMAASGGYMVASTADKFVIHPGSLTGSIGVILQTSSMEGLYEKLGIETYTFTTGEFKDDSNLYDEGSDGELSGIYQELVDEAYEQFLDVIVLGRGMDRDELEVLADGRIYSGRQAVKNGLADQEGYFEDAVVVTEDLAGISNSTVVDYSTYSIWSGFFSTPLEQIFGLQDFDAPLVGIYYLPSIGK